MQLLHWFSNNKSNLRRLVLSFEPAEAPSKMYVRQYKFHGSNDFLL